MRRTLLILLWILLAPLAGYGQAVRIANSDESFRAAPGGTVIATLDAGVALGPGEVSGDWREATLEGWIWAPSVRADQRSGFDLVVSARNGENLRATPNGDRIARLMTGTLLVEVKREGRWVQVRRTGWVRNAAIAHSPATADSATPNLSTHAESADEATGDSASVANTLDDLARADPNDNARLPRAGEVAWTGQVGTRILNAPGGDTLAAIRPMAAVEVLETEGEWARVRVEGWVWARTLASTIDTASVITGLAPEVLRSNPDQFTGRIIEWEIQFIALDRAEKIRTDFQEGELFILARPPGDQPGFVYLAVPDELAARARALAPLERTTILARVRTGRSAQMAAPILDLLEIR